VDGAKSPFHDARTRRSLLQVTASGVERGDADQVLASPVFRGGATSRLKRMVFLLCAGASITAASLQGQIQAPRAAGAPTVPHSVLHEFFTAIDTLAPGGSVDFFPRRGEVTYHTRTRGADGVVQGIWRFPAGEVPAALDGPLWPSFIIQFEGQPIGLVAHQVMVRGPEWVRVTPTRFVPLGEDVTSGIFVQWRLEDGRWVIDAFGDEEYGAGPLPPWCC
jgi:hypothetical protein